MKDSPFLSVNKQRRISMRSQSQIRSSLQKKQMQTMRNIKTANNDIILQKGKQLKITSKPIIPQDIRYSPILHQKTESAMQGSIIMLPKNIEQARHPKTQKKKSEKANKCIQGPIEDFKSVKTKQQRWINFSRRNMHQVSARLKNIRNSNYASNQNFVPQQRENFLQTKLNFELASFVCKSLEPAKTLTPKNQKLKNSQINIYENSSKGLIARKQILNKNNFEERLIIKQRSQSAFSNDFHTKLKKKCLENNPHLLAMVIKRKNETSDKEQLYQFVQKIIKKSKKI